jgi:hypothetical protein
MHELTWSPQKTREPSLGLSQRRPESIESNLAIVMNVIATRHTPNICLGGLGLQAPRNQERRQHPLQYGNPSGTNERGEYRNRPGNSHRDCFSSISNRESLALAPISSSTFGPEGFGNPKFSNRRFSIVSPRLDFAGRLGCVNRPPLPPRPAD